MSDYIEKEISGTKRYSFPVGIKEIPYKDKWLIVSPLTANWIVLDNLLQLSFLHLLYKYNLDTALSRFEGTEVDAQWVIVQLEARNFESTQTHLKQESSSVHLYLTNKCNMRCPHCYMYAGNSLENELNRDEIITLLNDLANSGISSIVFSGGEPLLNHNFKDYVIQASKNGMAVEVLSNGSLWNDSLIDELAPYLSSVQISIDGYDEESNSLIRGKDNFTKALHTVDRLIQCGVKTSVAMVPKWSDNLEREAHLYVKFAIDLIKRYKTKSFDFNIVGDIWEGREINLDVQEKKKFQKIISQMYRDIFGSQSEDSAFVAYHKGLGIEENCAYGNLSIAANGEVYLCAQIQPLNPIGNIRTHSICELLNKSKEAKEKSEISKLKPCKDCAIRYICGGDCRIKYFSYLDKGIIPNDSQIAERKCSCEYKESMYDLMIRTNELIFQ